MRPMSDAPPGEMILLHVPEMDTGRDWTIGELIPDYAGLLRWHSVEMDCYIERDYLVRERIVVEPDGWLPMPGEYAWEWAELPDV